MKLSLCLLSCVAVLTFLAGCEYKELCYDHSHVVWYRIIFDWSKSPDASPGSMSLYLFTKNGNKVSRYEFADRKGGVIPIQEGEYTALCLNSDTEGIYYRNTEKRTTFEVTTPTTTLMHGAAVPRAKGVGDERMSLEPDMLWCNHTDCLYVKRDIDGQSLTLYPQTGIHTYSITIHSVDNLEHVAQIYASISTMAGGILIGIGPDARTDERVTVPFGMVASPDKKSITGQVRTFGHCPSSVNSHKLVIYIVLDDGSKWYYTYDVTRQLHSAPDPQNVQIRLDTLPIPEPIGGGDGGGFVPDVDEWQDFEVDVNI